MRKIIEFIYYGNYFYGICALALIAETTIQLQLDLQDPFAYLIGFSITVLYYNYPYQVKKPSYTKRQNPHQTPQNNWFSKNYRFVKANQWFLVILLVFSICCVALKHGPQIRSTPLLYGLILSLFPLAALWYYGITISNTRYNLRKIGWLKPFLIGFAWAGLTYVFPLYYYTLTGSNPIDFKLIHLMLFVKSVMYIAMLAIYFDIKDSVSDKTKNLDTFIVKFGLKNTITYLIIPLTLLGIIMFFSYAIIHNFSMEKIALTMIPFILLLIVPLSFRKKRSLLFYLVVIDGLILVKALFSILASILEF